MSEREARIRELEKAVKSTPGFERWSADLRRSSLTTLGEWLAASLESRRDAAEELTGRRLAP